MMIKFFFRKGAIVSFSQFVFCKLDMNDSAIDFNSMKMRKYSKTLFNCFIF